MKAKCVVCGEELPEVKAEGVDISHCMKVDLLEWHPSQFPHPVRNTVYHNLWVCHSCARQIALNIAVNDSDFGIE